MMELAPNAMPLCFANGTFPHHAAPHHAFEPFLVHA